MSTRIEENPNYFPLFYSILRRESAIEIENILRRELRKSRNKHPETSLTLKGIRFTPKQTLSNSNERKDKESKKPSKLNYREFSFLQTGVNHGIAQTAPHFPPKISYFP